MRRQGRATGPVFLGGKPKQHLGIKEGERTESGEVHASERAGPHGPTTVHSRSRRPGPCSPLVLSSRPVLRSRTFFQQVRFPIWMTQIIPAHTGHGELVLEA